MRSTIQLLLVAAGAVLIGFVSGRGMDQLIAKQAWDAGYSTAFNAEHDFKKSLAVRMACSPYEQHFDRDRCYREMVKQGEAEAGNPCGKGFRPDGPPPDCTKVSLATPLRIECGQSCVPE